MKRRDFVVATAGVTALGISAPQVNASGDNLRKPIVNGKPLTAPPKDRIRVACSIAKNVVPIDFIGPWEVFSNVRIPDRGASVSAQFPFEVYSVATSPEQIKAAGGVLVSPNYTVDDAPEPDVVVIPAMRASDSLIQWIASVAPGSNVTMSVCTGALQLARTGLLDGLSATTHHASYDKFAKQFPEVDVVRNVRFVENDQYSTSAGLSAGIDLALRVVERYFGRSVAQSTADYLEYNGQDWIV